jgi:glycine/D-amino acid oxidase-like deaminating enzyme
MLRVFPELDGVAITHAWSGYVAYTRNVLPHTGGGDGVYHAMGYCGTGVARATYFGHKTALKVLGDKNGDTPFDDITFPRYPAHFIAARSVPVVVAWFRFRDWLDRPR